MKSGGWRAGGASLLAITAALGVPAVAAAQPMVSVGSLSSLQAGASAGTLHGRVLNETGRAADATVTVRLNRSYTNAPVVGSTTVRVGARSSAAYRVRVKLPSHLAKGGYYLSACTPSGIGGGLQGCATSAKDVVIGGAAPEAAPNAALARTSQAETCSSGARSLSAPGSKVYPETGNGGYTSVHTDVYNVYDAVNNVFLPGNHVDLTDRSTQCLTDFSLDFERSNSVTSTTTPGPNMTVDSVLVDGRPATFKFVQPTYPGDPNGLDDPDPAAHAASLNNPVSATNPNPPACTPTSASQNGTQCPATKLVITPSQPIPSGTTFKVTVNYTGRPGVHVDGDGSTEGWFRSNTPAGDGGFVTTEPVGTMAWMPLNNHPTAKPTYDFYDTLAYDPAAASNRVSVANGRLVSKTLNAPDANFPTGSQTFHWNMPEPVANYLVENSMGYYTLVEPAAPVNGVLYYEAQAGAITPANMATNKAVMDQQSDITNFQSTFNGPFPFSTDGVIVGFPSASFEEEMETKITFNGGRISLSTFNHENMHQWWGDNVSEGSYNLTFFKEGYAQLSQYLQTARTNATNAGGIGTTAGDAAFDATLVNQFNTNYNGRNTGFNVASSDPTAANLFGNQTYVRPATAYIALRQILGKDRFNAASQEIQRTYGGGSITEAQEEAVFRKYMTNQSAACNQKLTDFFTQWFDTAYPTTGTVTKPTITGPGLAGPGFYDASCPEQVNSNGSVGGSVPAQLALTLGAPAAFAPFVAGVAKDYTASTTATVISTGGDAALSVSDPSSTQPGHLLNSSFSLPQALKAGAASALGTSTPAGEVGGAPRTLLTYSGPASNDVATLSFVQSIGANDALRTGAYSKTLTFTLSTTSP